jgi:hypothetical protein
MVSCVKKKENKSCLIGFCLIAPSHLYQKGRNCLDKYLIVKYTFLCVAHFSGLGFAINSIFLVFSSFIYFLSMKIVPTDYYDRRRETNEQTENRRRA